MALTSCVDNETRLLVRYFPPNFSTGDKEDFLRHFGATQVTCMPKQSKLRCCAFATFASALDARKALVRLHQLKVLDSWLVAVYARPRHTEGEKEVQHSDSHDEDEDDGEEARLPKAPPLPTAAGSTATLPQDRVQPVAGLLPQALLGASVSQQYLPAPHIPYRYPPVSASIITNIAHTLACVPSFYSQVLHLMNKMNLPPPFGPVTPTPPVHGGNLHTIATPTSYGGVMSSPSSSCSSSADDESELEDGGAGSHQRLHTVCTASTALRKPRPVKRRRRFPPAAMDVQTTANRTAKPVEAQAVFDVVTQGKKSFDLSSLIETAVKAGQASLESIEDEDSMATSGATPLEAEPYGGGDTSNGAVGGGFGTFAPAPLIVQQESENDSDDLMKTLENTISRQELNDGRLSRHDIERVAVFKNYSPGEPTCRLYVKNLHKQVSEEDLRYIFGRFVDRESSEHLTRFNIRLMQEGRMKGQAFVTLATEDIADRARSATNGYVLHDKPMVVQFARSARAKS